MNQFVYKFIKLDTWNFKDIFNKKDLTYFLPNLIHFQDEMVHFFLKNVTLKTSLFSVFR